MDINCKEIKENARLNLKGNWKVAILSSFVYSMLSLIQEFMPESSSRWFSIGTTIYNSLFIFGYTAIMLHIVRGEKAEFIEMFTEYKRFFKGLGIMLVMTIYTILWSLLLVIPGIVAAIKYSMTFYIWVDNPDIGIDEAISESIEITEGHKLEIFKLVLSFIGWIALILVPDLLVKFFAPQYFGLIMSIGMIVLSPYIEVSMATLYTRLVNERQNR